MKPSDRPWRPKRPDQFLDRGHPAGDFLEAHEWKVLERRAGYYRIDAHLPQHVKNPRGALFGGFTPTYIDLLAIHTARSQNPDAGGWMLTLNMRVDYLAPVLDERFIIESRTLHKTRSTFLVEVRILAHDDRLLVTSLVTLRATDVDPNR